MVQSTSANRAPPAGRKQELTCFCDFCAGSRGPSKGVAEHDGRRDIAPIRQPLPEAQVLSTSVPWHLATWVTSSVQPGLFSIAGARVSQESPSSWHHSLIAISFCLAVSGSGPLRGLPVKSPARVQPPMTRRHHVRAVHVVGGAGAYELSARFEWQYVRYRFARSPADQHRLETPTNQRVCAMCPRVSNSKSLLLSAFCSNRRPPLLFAAVSGSQRAPVAPLPEAPCSRRRGKTDETDDLILEACCCNLASWALCIMQPAKKAQVLKPRESPLERRGFREVLCGRPAFARALSKPRSWQLGLTGVGNFGIAVGGRREGPPSWPAARADFFAFAR